MGDSKDPNNSPYAPLLAKHRPDLSIYEGLYKDLHRNGELSTQEKETAALIEDFLKKLASQFKIDLEIKTGIGGHGLIAILRNGEGPTVLLRADVDALPIKEKTDLPYASTKTMKDTDGEVKPVMRRSLP